MASKRQIKNLPSASPRVKAAKVRLAANKEAQANKEILGEVQRRRKAVPFQR